MMLKRLLSSSLLIFLATSVLAADPVGSLLALQGSATVVRQGKSLPLDKGSLLEEGDLVRVAQESRAQIRFVDGAIVALRPNTEFRIDAYQMPTQAGNGQSALGLVKGGLRTITGQIAKSNPAGYAVKTETATVGVRGTHYTLRLCAQDCRQDNGETAADGLYGSVTEGVISVANEGGEQLLQKGDFFRVSSRSTPADRLIAPPSFLRDQLEQAGDDSPEQATAFYGIRMATEENATPEMKLANKDHSAETGTNGYSPLNTPTIGQPVTTQNFNVITNGFPQTTTTFNFLQ